MGCPCDNDKKRITVVHAKGVYIKPYKKKPCDDCAKKEKKKSNKTRGRR